jgi:hypothetical protein
MENAHFEELNAHFFLLLDVMIGLSMQSRLIIENRL